MRIRLDHFMSWFQTVLHVNSYVMIQRGEQDTEFYEFVYLAGPHRMRVLANPRWVPAEELSKYRLAAGTYVLTVIHLAHIDAVRATNSLRPLFGHDPQSQITAGEGRTVALTGFAPTVVALAQALTAMDRPTPADPATGQEKTEVKDR
jgi:hypothetical protein